MIRQFCLVALFVSVCFTAVAQPVFKGGQTALDRFIIQNIVYPEYSRQNCIDATIKVGFRLSTDGKVDTAFVQEGPGIDLGDEAVRIVKMTSGKWTVPADFSANSIITIPITFTPDYTRCTGTTGANREAAIANYKAQEQLQDVITNYYKHNDKSKSDPALDAQIEGLKKQLGYDDDFISDLLDQAMRKYKQGDKNGACKDWNFVHNIGSDRADGFISKYCK